MVRAAEEKVIGLSENEFIILADACSIRHILCFDPAQGRKAFREVSRQEYPQVVHALAKRGILIPAGGEMVISEEVADMMKVCRQPEYMLFFEGRSGSEHASSCLYLQKNGCFVTAMPGSRTEEYIRLGMHAAGTLQKYLLESEFSDPQYWSFLERIALYDGTTGMRVAEYTSEDHGADRFPPETMLKEIVGKMGGKI